MYKVLFHCFIVSSAEIGQQTKMISRKLIYAELLAVKLADIEDKGWEGVKRGKKEKRCKRLERKENS